MDNMINIIKFKSWLYYRVLASDQLHVWHPPRTIHRTDQARQFRVEDPSARTKNVTKYAHTGNN